MSSGSVLDQASTGNVNSPSATNNTNNNGNNGTVNNNGNSFQSVRNNNAENVSHQYENHMQMFTMKQQPMTSPITGTVYTGPPAKYLNNGSMNSNGYASGGSGRQMSSQQNQHRHGGNHNSNNSGPSGQGRRQNQNHNGVDNSTNDSVNTRKVFVGGLSPDTKMDHLCDYFSKFGNVESATVKFDKSGRSKGFGFVLFKDRDSTDQVYSQDVHVIQGKRVDTKSAHRRDQALARKVFVGGLDPEVTDVELREYFSKFGKIAQVEAPMDKVKQKRRPFCFILFENEQSAEDVLKQPRHTIAGKAIDCKRANPKSTETNQPNINMPNPMQAPIQHYGMAAGLNTNPFQYQQQPRSQQPSSHQQLQYQQAALAAQQTHYSFYNSSSMGMSSGQPNNQQGQNRSQSNRQQLPSNNQGLTQHWSPISPAQWPTTSYPDPRSYGSYAPSSASGSNAAWQVGPPQGTSYATGRTQSAGPAGNPANPSVGPPQAQAAFGGANSNSAQYQYPTWSFSQAQGSQGPPSAGPPPNQYNYGTDSSNAPPNAFAYQAPTGYDHFSSDAAPPPNYNR